MPLGLDRSTVGNLFFVLLVVGGLLAAFRVFERCYGPILSWCLAHKGTFLMVPVALLATALCIWLGFSKVFAFAPKMLGEGITQTRLWEDAANRFPGLGREFRPALDEGSFLFMPTVSPHASIDEAIDSLRKLDSAIASIPEVYQVVGKIGRAYIIQRPWF